MENKISSERDNYYIINVYFGKKDLDIMSWVKSVPKGLFSYIIREALKCDIDEDYNFEIPYFEVKNRKTAPIYKPISIPKEEVEIIEHLESLEEQMRSFYIKQIIRNFLNYKKNDASQSNRERKEITQVTPKPSREDIIENNNETIHYNFNSEVVEEHSVSNNIIQPEALEDSVFGMFGL